MCFLCHLYIWRKFSQKFFRVVNNHACCDFHQFMSHWIVVYIKINTIGRYILFDWECIKIMEANTMEAWIVIYLYLIIIFVYASPLMQRQVGILLDLTGTSLRAFNLPHITDIDNLSYTLILNTTQFESMILYCDRIFQTYRFLVVFDLSLALNLVWV